MTSLRLIPTRNSSRSPIGTSELRSAMPRCISTAQRTASTTPGNSTSMPSPVVLRIRPRCSAILGSTRARRCAISRSSVSLLFPAHQPRVSRHIGGRTAAKRRTAGVSIAAVIALLQLGLKSARKLPQCFPVASAARCSRSCSYSLPTQRRQPSAPLRAPTACAMAPRVAGVSASAFSMTKSWIVPLYWTDVTRTPASDSLRA